MKNIIISILILILSSANLEAMELTDQQTQQMYLQQTINTCNAQLMTLQQQIQYAQAMGDVRSYNYLVWQYQGLKAQCDQEVLKIQSGYYNR